MIYVKNCEAAGRSSMVEFGRSGRAVELWEEVKEKEEEEEEKGKGKGQEEGNWEDIASAAFITLVTTGLRLPTNT